MTPFLRIPIESARRMHESHRRPLCMDYNIHRKMIADGWKRVVVEMHLDVTQFEKDLARINEALDKTHSVISPNNETKR